MPVVWLVSGPMDAIPIAIFRLGAFLHARIKVGCLEN
jgi:hypothetical protein